MGQLTLSNSTVYNGFFEQGRIVGQAEVSYPNGTHYKGSFAVRGGRSVYQGQGIYISPDGHRYEGQFADGKRQGSGTLELVSGIRIEGEWKDGRRWTITVYEPDGSERGRYVQGVWESP